MRILVTGGAGYIGSHACKILAAAGLEPVVVDNLVTGHLDAVKWGPLEQGDILDTAWLDQVFARHRPDAVLHFAASAYVGESVSSPEKYYLNNVNGTLSLLKAMRSFGVGEIVFSSSCATYGIPDTLPISETTPQQPINPYGFTKLVAERALADYGQAYGLKWVSLRYFNAAGCDPEGELAERHDPETHAIPLAIRAAAGIGPKFHVFGTDYGTRDGSAVRDYIHVSDLGDAHLKAIEYLRGGGESRAFNLATGKGTSVLELLRSVAEVMGTEVPAEFHPRRPGDPHSLYAVAERARLELGWSPRFRDIDTIVATAVPAIAGRQQVMRRPQEVYS